MEIRVDEEQDLDQACPKCSRSRDRPALEEIRLVRRFSRLGRRGARYVCPRCGLIYPDRFTVDRAGPVGPVARPVAPRGPTEGGGNTHGEAT